MILLILKKLADILYDRQIRETLKGSLIAFSLKIFGVSLGFIFNIILARFLGVEGVGVYYLAVTITTVGSVVGRIGLDNSMMRYTAINASKGDWQKVKGVYKKGITIATAVSLLLAGASFFLAPLIAIKLFNQQSLIVPLRILSFSILPTSLLNLHAEVLKALGKIPGAMLVQSLGLPLISIPLLLLVGKPLHTTQAAIVNVTGCFIILLLSIFLWKRETPQLKGIYGDFPASLLIRTSTPLLWVNLMNLVISYTDIIILGIWMDSKSVGVYGVASRIALLSSMFLMAVNNIVGPKFSTLWAEKDHKGLAKLASSSTAFMSLVAILTLLPFLTVPNLILGVFGPSFISGSYVLEILAFGQFIALATGPVAFLLMMTGNERFHRNNVILSAVTNVVLAILLVPSYGLEGAALAAACSLIIKNLLAVIFVKKKLNICLYDWLRKESD